MPKRKKSSDKYSSQMPSGTAISPASLLRVSAGTALLVLAAFIVYLPSISGGFLLDDNLLLTENNLIRDSNGLYRFWCTADAADYWPASYTTLWIEWRLWRMNSTGYHATNMILHAVEVLLIWLILRKLAIPGAFLAAMLFAVHPVNVESVAWIASRKNLVAMLFFLLSILWYLKQEISPSLPQNRGYQSAPPREPRPLSLASRPSPLFYWLSLIAFVLSMLGKGSTVVLPLLLLGIILWLRPLTRRDLMRTAPFFAIAALLAGVNVWFQPHGSQEVFRTAGFVERLLTAAGMVWFYFYKALWPADLILLYPLWRVEVGNPLWWLPLSAALLATAVLWRYRNGWSRPLLFAWAFFCAALVPVMGFTDIGFMRYSLVADRYQHISIIGMIVPAAAGFYAWHQRARDAVRRTASIAAVAAVGVLIFLASRQSGLYRDAVSLYQATLKKNPDSWIAHNNLGTALVPLNRPDEAIEHYHQALVLNPRYADAHNNLGNALQKKGRYQEAIEHYRQALALKPNYLVHYNLGNALLQIDQPAEAIDHLRQTLRFKPDNFEIHYKLGNALIKTGRSEEAIEHYQQALKLKPDYFDAHNNLGNTLFELGRLQEAVEHYKQAIIIKPNFANVYFNLVQAYAKLNQSAEAIDTARKALVLARSQNQTELAKKIEAWLSNLQAGIEIKD